MKKILKITGIILVIIVLFLFISPFLFKDRINREVKSLANKSLKSELNYGEVKLSFFTHFPTLTLTLGDFLLKGSAPFEQDTLISAREIGFGLNLKSLFGKQVVITRVYLDRATIKILFSEHGAANYNVYRSGDSTAQVADTTKATGSTGLSIEQISFRDSKLTYADASIPFSIFASGLEYSGKSSFTSDLFDVTSDIRIKSFDLVYDQKKLIDGKPVTGIMKTKINMKDLSVVFEKNDLKIRDIPFQFNGKFNFVKDGYAMNLSFLSVLEREFVSARFKITQDKRMWMYARVNASVDLGKWAKAFELKAAELRGHYDLTMNAEGSYATTVVKKGPRQHVDTVISCIPKFEIKTRLTNGYFKIAAMPQALTSISFNLDAACPDTNYQNINVQFEDFRAAFLKNDLKGYFRMKRLADAPIDASLTGSLNLAELRQVYPMDSLDVSGIVDMNVSIKGNYAPAKKMFPVTTAMIGLKDGEVRTKYYPHPLEKINMTAEVTDSKGTMQDLSVKLKPLTFAFEGKPFTITANLANFDDMAYDVQSKGVVDLGKIYKVFSRKGMELDGYIETDLSLKGRQSDAMAGRVQKLNNKGTLKLRDIAVRSDDYPKPFIIKTGDFRFDQDKIWFENFLARYGASDFRLKGSVLNTVSYMLNQGKPLKGDFQLNSDLINVDEFMYYAPADKKVAAKPAQTGVVVIPADLDIVFKADVKKTNFDGLDIRDLKGELKMKQGILVLSKGGLNLAGCDVGMDGSYGSISPEKAYFDFHVKAENFDIKRAYNEVALIRELATSAGSAEGIVSMEYSLKGNLNGNMFPIMPSLDGGGVVSLKKIKVKGLKLFNDISKSTERPGLNNPDMSKVDIKSTIKNNIITVEQFKFKVSGLRIRMSGTSTLDSRLNLKIRIGLPPLGLFGIPLKVTGPADNFKIRYGKGKESDELKDSEYSDELPAEMRERLKNAKDDTPDEGEPEK